MNGTVTVRVEVSRNGEIAVGEVQIPKADARHVCGSRGYGMDANDRCPMCDASRLAGDIARDKLEGRQEEEQP